VFSLLIHQHSFTYQNVVFKSLPRAGSAEYNSGPTGLRRPCTLHTREQILSDLMQWATDDSQPPVYWLTGMAGTGKTTITYSFCEMLAKHGMLGASFFCSRTVEETSDPKIILPTISHQLSARSKVFASALLKVIQEDDNIGNRPLPDQFNKLILLPMTSFDVHPKCDLIVFDGSDEAKRQDEIRSLVSLLLKHSAKLRVKIFISSRYEAFIKGPFERAGSHTHTSFLLHNIEDHIVEADIKHYMLEHLNEISEQIQEPRLHWISDEQVSQLVNRSGKLFVYAAVLCSFIGQGTAKSELEKRLDAVLSNMSGPIPGRNDRVYEFLDDLYSQVLNAVAVKVDAIDIKMVLGVILAATHPLSINSITALLGVNDYRVDSVVTGLTSVLTVSNHPLDTIPITIFHASFRDYLTIQERSGKFCIDIKHGHQSLAEACFQVMKEQLCFNKCNIASSYHLNADLTPEQIDYISPTLFYACQFWSDHLKGAVVEASLQNAVSYLMQKQILFWIEILSIKGAFSVAIPALESIRDGQVCYVQCACLSLLKTHR
jgi:hypothetical protein